MGYYGASSYRGDYYRGDYYLQRRGPRGDLLDWLGGVAGNVVTSIFGPAAPKAGPAPALMPMPMLPMLPKFAGGGGGSSGGGGVSGEAGGVATAAAIRAAEAAGGIYLGKGGCPGGGGHHRRINPLNPKALRRALRRAEGFKHFAQKTLRLVGEKKHIAGFKKHKKGHR